MKITLKTSKDVTYPIQDALEAAANVARGGLPVPPGLARANGWMSPLGPAPGRGWLCIKYGDLKKMDRDDWFTLVLDDSPADKPNTGNVQEVVPIYFLSGTNLTPSHDPEDEDACYLTEWADSRWLLQNPYYSQTIQKQYNVPAPNSGLQYYEGSRQFPGTSNTADWTWDEMVKDIWNTMQQDKTTPYPIGPYPGLPRELMIDAKPSGFQYIGVPAWQALNDVLDRLLCAVSWQPNKPQSQNTILSIVQRCIAKQDDYNNPIFNKMPADKLIWDAYPQEGNRARFPDKVRVYFNNFSEHYGSEQTTPVDTTQWQTSKAFTTKDVLLKDLGINLPGTPSGVPQECVHALWDDELAIIDIGGNLKSDSDSNLKARANERAKKYYKNLLNIDRMHRIYTGLWPFLPGILVSGVSWREYPDQGGLATTELVTEVIRFPHLVRVSDQGQWEACDRFGQSVTMRAPDFNPSWPLYPPLVHLVQVSSNSPDGAGFWPATFIQTDVTKNPFEYRVKEDCFLVIPQ